MILDRYIGFPAHVNRIILDSSTPTFGDNALTQQQTEGGLTERSRGKNFIPDKYNITMSFSWEPDDYTPVDGETEYTRFMKWYKYYHKYGLVPFEFPQILYSPESGIKSVDESGNFHNVEYYSITSAVPGKKSGSRMEVTMTWNTVFFGAVTIEPERYEVASFKANAQYCDIAFSSLGDTLPASANFQIFARKKAGSSYGEYYELKKIGYYFNDYTARVYYDKITTAGTYEITFSYKDVAKETFIHEIIVQ